MSSHHLYVHVPFCRLVCAYCDFVTVGGRASLMPRYVEALHAELARRPAEGTLETISFGGGTPSLLPVAAVAGLVAAASERWGTTPLEVALEANPSHREAADWTGLRAAGVTRLSLGVQSLDDRDLTTLARGHTAAEAVEAYRAVRAAGFANVNLDLIYGIPGQGAGRWRRTLGAAIALGPEHVSLYALQLAIEPDEWAAPPRPGALRWRRRLAALQDDGLAGAQYETAEEMLDRAGYLHYELSNWARPGFASRHNEAYWTRRPYTGIGAGAHSYDGAALRSWNERDLDRYLARIEAGGLAEAGSETLDAPTRAFEALALGLRRIEGVRRSALCKELGEDPAKRWPAAMTTAIDDGLLAAQGDWLRLTPRGRLLASEVLVRFLPAA